jgi:uncharacterized phage protein gp47/JayE
MPWSTPTLKDVRKMTRDSVAAALTTLALVPNGVLRVMTDAMAGLGHLVLLYIDWLALQLLPDTAETEWLDRHGDIWLVNADGSTGRKVATFAKGSVLCTGVEGAVVPVGAEMQSVQGIMFEVMAQTVVGTAATSVPVRALEPGTGGNLSPFDVMGFVPPITDVDPDATVEQIGGATDQETDDELRARVLLRIQEPPMGGDATDYVQWTLSVPGVTRAWSYPLEMGIGTVTVRFMMDDLRADSGGFPLPEDVAAVQAYLDRVRPVAVKDFFVEAPIPYPINFTITNIDVDTQATRNAIEASLRDMFFERIAPSQEIYFSVIDEAISQAPGENHHDLTFTNTPMPAPGYMGVLGAVSYVPATPPA